MRHADEHEDQKEDATDETVGYKRPPKRTQFQKGKSGNPHGRPKGTLNLKTVVARTIQEPVLITEQGRKTTITKLEAAIKQVVNKAASGDARATAQLVALVQAQESHGDESASQALSEEDERVKARILNKLTRQTQKGGTSHDAASDPI